MRVIFTLSLFVVALVAQAQHMPHMVHPALETLMSLDGMTHQATQSGHWSDPATWGGQLPPDGAKVYIPSGFTVVVDGEIAERLKHIRVDGTLRFATAVDTKLQVETLATWPGSLLEVGTENKPIAGNVKAHIVLIDNGLLDINQDPELLGRALIPQGKVRFYGQEKTTWLQAAEWVPTGSQQVTLQAAPHHWAAGDRVVLSGTFSEEQEVFEVAAIDGATVTLSAPTVNDRTIASSHPAFEGEYPYLANYTRNIIIESENKESIPNRGHLMFMHTQDVVVKYVQVEELGRTDKSREFVHIADLQTATDNSIARYGMHFHRAGDQDPNAQFALVEGCALWGSPGWGYVNHESSVWFVNNASYGVFGSHFTDENGTELGGFRGNIAIYSIGSSDTAGGFSEKTRTDGDHGHTGVGFWATSGATVRWEDNVATDHNMAGYAIVSRRAPADRHEYDLSLHDIDNLGGGKTEASSGRIGMNFFRNNVNHGGNTGIVIVDMELNGTFNSENVFDGFTIMNTKRAGLSLEYTRNLTFRNTKIIRDDPLPAGRWRAKHAIDAKGTWDHFFNMDAKGYTILDNVVTYNFVNGFNIQRGDTHDVQQDSRVLVLDNCEINLKPDGVLADNMDFVVQGVSKKDLPGRPVFSTPGGTYNAGFGITLSAAPDEDIYYVVGKNPGWNIAAVSRQLAPVPEQLYQGETITIDADDEVIFAMSVKNGITGRATVAYYALREDGQEPVAVAVTGVEILNEGPIALPLSDDITLDITVYPATATNAAVSWFSSDTEVAQVSSQGSVIAVGEGSATITVETADGGFTDVVTIQSTPLAVESVAINPGSFSAYVGRAKQLQAQIAPDNASNQAVTWASADQSIATVNALGLLMAKGEGSTTITVTTLDGSHQGTAEVTVLPAPLWEDWVEDFAGLIDGTTANPDAPWSSTAGAVVSEGFRISDEEAEWFAGPIDIGSAGPVTLSMDITGDPTTGDGMEPADYIYTYYRIDGGPWVQVSHDTGEFATKTVSASGLEGVMLEVRVVAFTTAADEMYVVDNIAVRAETVIETFVLQLSAEHGTITPSSHQVAFLAGSVVQLTAVADPGYEFAEWTGDLTGTANPGEVTMNGNRSIGAVFLPTGVVGADQLGEGIALFPNPTHDRLQCTAPGAIDLQLIDLAGKVVLTRRGEAQLTVDVRHLPAGLYIAKINDSRLKLVVR